EDGQWAGGREQRGGDDREQRVLGHVGGEARVRERVERRSDREPEREGTGGAREHARGRPGAAAPRESARVQGGDGDQHRKTDATANSAASPVSGREQAHGTSA